MFSSFFFTVLGFKLRASCLLIRCSTTWALCQPFFELSIFEIESHKLLPQTGFEPRSPWSLIS
jgi:hypothetical protein